MVRIHHQQARPGNRDAPDTVLPDIRFIQKPDTGYPVRAGYRISGRILGLTTIFLVKYTKKLIKTALTIIAFCKH
jgi:hypothetical protein